MNCPVEYAKTLFEDIDTISGVHKPDFYLFPSQSENHVKFRNASPQECVGGVPKHQDSQQTNSTDILWTRAGVHVWTCSGPAREGGSYLTQNQKSAFGP